jgi:ribA/ribD-fused uncharacterized protein
MILEFKNEYRWLSNFALYTIIVDDIEYISVEHAYQAAKSNDIVWKKFCSTTISLVIVKRESIKVILIEDWDFKKIEIMYLLVKQKFTQEPYYSLLLDTRNEELQEGNVWHDTFFGGVDLKTGKGKNILGLLLMKIRKELNYGKSINRTI